MNRLPAPDLAGTGRSFVLAAGAGFGADSNTVPVVEARWLYAGVKQERREMVRVGLEP